MSFEDKNLLFGGAQAGTPWGTLGEITGRALTPLGYKVQVVAEASRDRNPRLLSAGQVDLGATNSLAALWAYDGRQEDCASSDSHELSQKPMTASHSPGLLSGDSGSLNHATVEQQTITLPCGAVRMRVRWDVARLRAAAAHVTKADAPRYNGHARRHGPEQGQIRRLH